VSLLRTLFFLLTLPYVLGVIAFGAVWTLLGESRWWVALVVNFAPLFILPAFVLFPLALLIRAKRAALLLLPVLVSGVILFGGYFVPRTTAPAAPAWSLRVIALNVSDRLQPIARIEEWLRANPVDVVVLAEVHRPLRNTIPRMADMYPYSAGQARTNAVAVLSRYPISASSGWIEDEFGYRQFPQVTLQVGDQPVTVIATSLDSPAGVRGRILLPDMDNRFINGAWDMLWGYSDTSRSAEVAKIVDWVATAPNPVIVAGDMNLAEQSSDYNHLASVLVDSYRDAATGFGFTFPAWEAFRLPSGLPPVMRIDYIWHTSDLVTLEARSGDYVGSDHLPVLATIGGY